MIVELWMSPQHEFLAQSAARKDMCKVFQRAFMAKTLDSMGLGFNM
jgi:hypothetical protein